MSVDKFGLMPNDSSTTVSNIIQPFTKYEYSLDDLENVKGFNDPGKKDGIYGFRLKENGVYTRNEISRGIDSTIELLNDLEDVEGFDVSGREDARYVFQMKDGKYRRIELVRNFNDWDLDFNLQQTKVVTGGNNHEIHKIFNSGKMFISLVPTAGSKIVLSKFLDDYVLKAKDNSLDVNSDFLFRGEFKEDENVLKSPPVGSTIIIEGYTGPLIAEMVPLLRGLKIKWNDENKFKFFRLVIQKRANDYIINHNVETEIDAEVDGEVRLNDLKITSNVLIKRLLFTAKPITDDEIKYLL